MPPNEPSSLPSTQSVATARLRAVVHVDMVGYSRLVGLDPEGLVARLKTMRREFIDPLIARHSARIINTAGDSMLLEFVSITGAVAWAIAAQRGVPAYDGDIPETLQIRFRMGVNIGDMITDGSDLHGDGINVAARLQRECPAGGLVVSRSVHDHVRDRLDVEFEPLGSLILKNIAHPVEAFVLRDCAPRSVEASAAQTQGYGQGQGQVWSQSQVSNLGLVLPPPVLPPGLSLVVLPFQNMSGEPDQEYFVDGLVEDITSALTSRRTLFVISRNLAFTYKGRAVDVRQVGRELGVRYVLEGSVRKSAGQVRIAVQLVDAVTGAQLWADRFDKTMADGFALQDHVTLRVAAMIEPHLQRVGPGRTSGDLSQDSDVTISIKPGQLIPPPRRLRVVEPAKARQVVVLDRLPLVIGRALPAGLLLEDRLVSRAHCQIDIQDGRVTVTDLDSTNGTMIGDHPLCHPTPLEHGMILRVGPFVVIYEADQEF